jgi:hypothetical protein
MRSFHRSSRISVPFLCTFFSFTSPFFSSHPQPFHFGIPSPFHHLHLCALTTFFFIAPATLFSPLRHSFTFVHSPPSPSPLCTHHLFFHSTRNPFFTTSAFLHLFSNLHFAFPSAPLFTQCTCTLFFHRTRMCTPLSSFFSFYALPVVHHLTSPAFHSPHTHRSAGALPHALFFHSLHPVHPHSFPHYHHFFKHFTSPTDVVHQPPPFFTTSALLHLCALTSAFLFRNLCALTSAFLHRMAASAVRTSLTPVREARTALAGIYQSSLEITYNFTEEGI